VRSTIRRLVLGLCSVAVAGVPVRPAAAAPVPIQRFLLVIGANAGGGDRAKLQYAISDAERFARVMIELGGVPPANEVVLKQPRLTELVDALDALNTRVKDARRAKDGGRIEVILYYSGHADEHGLLLGGERYAYRTLRDRLDAIPADVRIAVLDACASGAFTRLKGGRLRAPFLVDESADMRGHAFLTSSAATEAAQESDRIRASYFTHYLVSGFRGAADLTGDGKVTLSEAYQFAFNETLGRTVDTRGGAQHPSYDINLSGSGDVVMTDVRQTSATIVLGEDLDGRFFIFTAARELVVELNKPYGRKVELAVEPGAYEIRLDRDKTSTLAKTRLEDGASVTIEARQFAAAPLESTRTRGDGAPQRLAVAGRNRIDGTQSFSFIDFRGRSVAGQSRSTAIFGIRYTHYLREDLAVTAAFDRGLGGVVAGVSELGTSTSQRAGFALKPFIAGSVGPVFGSTASTFGVNGAIVTDVTGQTRLGVQAGGGVDIHVARAFALGISAGYKWMNDFSGPAGALDNFSGPAVAISFGFMFGKGR
jgi:hypothetical protein